MKLNLQDLKPQEVELEISENPGKKYVLKKFSLAARIWTRERFGEERIRTIFENRSLPEVSEIAYYLLKDKTDFPTLKDFQEALSTQQDFIALLTALLTTLGLSEPVIKKLSKQEQEAGNAQRPNP